ncbi:aspartate kinase [Aquimarina sp. EL_43]|uniref:aspartate kinase n=1 Tax=unclassified Aquimarina TaxID=2627091 RepID=UPI0018CB637C|nr:MULTISPECIES: aspartate kinase [unclassified Aquimarina]MBG6132746.1 aspartate kinase [Aquimarina sp. EL_35]MBG6153177.1 aspartate kinase [Aquimarina sp. EL_32]MBG6171333.1 aspartate kinase [Aquimarina sp. EL_43]
MRVFKFGGASVKDANGVKNVLNVLDKTGFSNLVIVISAMGKTTNALEHIVDLYINNNKELKISLRDLEVYHNEILEALFENKQHPVFKKIERLLLDMQTTLNRNKSTQYDYVYDQIVPYGELISTTIVSEYLNHKGYQNKWLDARDFIKTDTVYRDAEVDWQTTQHLILEKVNKNSLSITQGFIGSDENNFTTTLGREGSDYTAGILAYCLNADSVSIWKDVPGVLNADPRVFDKTQLLSHISYEEAIELAFYGASVIHPKTIQPLQRKEIPLYVKSFLNPVDQGTSVKKGQPLDPHLPCYIVKKNQVLVSLSSLDFSFIVENNISEIFSLFHQYHIKVDLIQNSAISFSVCLDDKFDHFEKLLGKLKAKFRVTYNTNVSLFTIRHFTNEAITSLEKNKDILLKQITRETYQMVSRD